MRRALVVLLAGLVVAPAAEAKVRGGDIVRWLNAQRAAHGLPAGITEDRRLSAACAKHNAYGRRNRLFEHRERRGRRGYTRAGDRVARQAVLYANVGSWTASRNPFEDAPIHLHQLLQPRIDRMGASEDRGWGCATTKASRRRPAPAADVAYTYPGDGVTGWRPAQVAAEAPYTPGQRLGIRRGARTGPYLLVWFDGPGLPLGAPAKAASATLTGPAGPVPVAVADTATPGLTAYLRAGMMVIPRAPLLPGATYVASVAATVAPGGGAPPRAFSRTWSFTTGALPNAVRIITALPRGQDLVVRVQSTAPGAVVSADGPGGVVRSSPVGRDGTARVRLDLAGGWRVCARSGGAGTAHEAREACLTIPVSFGRR